MYHALVVDDKPANLDVLALLLEQEGFTYTAVESPRRLMELVETLGQIRIVFLDLEIPNHDMFEVMKTLKAHPRLVGVPIIAYSVHTSEINEARRAGFDGFLGKPVNTRLFPSQLKQILNVGEIWHVGD